MAKLIALLAVGATAAVAGAVFFWQRSRRKPFPDGLRLRIQRPRGARQRPKGRERLPTRSFANQVSNQTAPAMRDTAPIGSSRD
jgi:hypothetical protein